jgi:lysophospholipase L1-like esterase
MGRRARVPAVMVSHETADGVLRTWGLSENMSRRTADALNVRTAHTYARVVCTTEFAEREFVRIGARNVVRAPLGVDLVGRTPPCGTRWLRAEYARVDEVLLVTCTRLSVEKKPGTALDALEALLRRGRRAVLVVAGDGPLRARLEQRARERGLPVTFLGHVSDRRLLGALQASADVCLAPGPAETFGLAALEAMACGTPVVASASSALPEVIGSAGATAADNGRGLRGRRGHAPRTPRGGAAGDRTRACRVFRLAHGGRRVPRRARRGCSGTAVRARRRGMRTVRFVALGDSLTEGVGDPVGEAWRGWAALLADGLAEQPGPVEFTNLAVSGAQTRDVLERQTPAGLALNPDVVSVVIGVNDTLRCTFDIQAVAARLDEVYAAFTAQGAVLLTACLPDPGAMLGLPGALARPLARRQRAVNTVVHALSERYGAVHLHAAEGEWIMDRAIWSADRLHPGERGHRQLALRFPRVAHRGGRGLGGRALARARVPGAHQVGEPAVAGDRGHRVGGPPLHRPAAPTLRLAADEMRHRARGTSARLDLSASHAVSMALAALSVEQQEQPDAA